VHHLVFVGVAESVRHLAGDLQRILERDLPLAIEAPRRVCPSTYGITK